MCVCALCGCSNTLIVLFLVVGIQTEVSQHEGADPAWRTLQEETADSLWNAPGHTRLTGLQPLHRGRRALQKTQHRPPTGLSSEAYIRQWSALNNMSTVRFVVSVVYLRSTVCPHMMKQIEIKRGGDCELVGVLKWFADLFTLFIKKRMSNVHWSQLI